MITNFQKEIAKARELRHKLVAIQNGLNATRVNFLFQEARLGIQLAQLAIDSKNCNNNEALLRQSSAAHDALQVILRFSPTVDLLDHERGKLESLLHQLRSCLARV